MAVLTRRAADVRITEIDLTSSLNGASPSTGAIVVVSRKGPLAPTFYSSADEFRRAFGDPDAKVSFDHYCALDYFKGGNALWVTRAVGTGYRYSAGVVKLNSALATVIAPIPAGVADPRDPDFTAGLLAGEIPLFQITANNGPGSYGDSIAVEIESENTATPSGTSITTTTLGGSLLPATYEYVVSAVGRSGETLPSAPMTIIIGAATTTNTVTLNWTPVAGAIGYKIYGRTPGAYFYIDQVGGATTSYTDTGNITPNVAQLPPVVVAPPSPIFFVKVFDLSVSSTRAVETFTCSLTEQIDDTGMQMEVMQRINPFSRYIRVESNINNLATIPTLGYAARSNLGGGNSGATPTSVDINNGWDQFRDTSRYVIDILINAGRASPSIQYKMDAVAQARGDCVAHLDAPSTANSAQAVVDYRNLALNLSSSYSMLSCSDVLQQDPINGKLLYIPISGLTAGLQARVSRTTQPWFSIAGLNRGQLGVSDIRLSFDDGAATLLYQNNLSYARRFVGKGIVFWEANTLYAKNSALQFLNIRVLLNILKRTMYDYLSYALQEPGDDILRKQVSYALESYLTSVQAGRGISSFRVVIDESNNPPALVNSGVLAVAVIIVPILAVREVQLSLAISSEGAEITEAEIASW